MDKLKVGLFGFGCVGQGLYEIIERENLPIELTAICVKDPAKTRILEAERFSYDPQIILNDPNIDVVVEAIDDADSAFLIAKQALLGGKKFVTANKKMVAEHLDELLFLRNDQNNLRYEAAVCGSIPIVNTIDNFYAAEPLQTLSGIFNGSSNYILTQIRREGLDYQQALKQAQDLGFAESDPTLDVGGLDSLNKLVILLAHGYGVNSTPGSLLNLGIQNLTAEDFKFASDRNLKIKLLAKAVHNGALNAYVMPSFIAPDNPLWSVEDEYNAVLLRGRYSDTHLYTGKGAGSHPTAASVLADVVSVAKDQRYRYPKHQSAESIEIDNHTLIKIYLRYQQNRQLEEFSFDKIYGEGRTQNGGFVLGTIKLSYLWSLQTYIEEQGLSVVDISSVQEQLTTISTKQEVQLAY